MLDEKVREVLETVAQGVWCQQTQTSREGHIIGVFSQCAFCYVAPHSLHDKDCPVMLAREVLDANQG